MNCMKCGRNIEEGAVFCPDCLTDMDKYPVKPGIVVHIPVQAAAPVVKKSGKRVLTIEEKFRRSRKIIRILVAALLVSVTVTVGAVLLAIYGLQDEESEFLPGQNYTSQTTSSTEEK